MMEKQFYFQAEESVSNYLLTISEEATKNYMNLRRAIRNDIKINIYHEDDECNFDSEYKYLYPIGQMKVDIFDIGFMSKLDLDIISWLDAECDNYLSWYLNLDKIKIDNRNNVVFIYDMAFYEPLFNNTKLKIDINTIISQIKGFIEYYSCIKVDWIVILPSAAYNLVFEKILIEKKNDTITICENYSKTKPVDSFNKNLENKVISEVSYIDNIKYFNWIENLSSKDLNFYIEDKEELLRTRNSSSSEELWNNFMGDFFYIRI